MAEDNNVRREGEMMVENGIIEALKPFPSMPVEPDPFLSDRLTIGMCLRHAGIYGERAEEIEYETIKELALWKSCECEEE